MKILLNKINCKFDVAKKENTLENVSIEISKSEEQREIKTEKCTVLRSLPENVKHSNMCEVGVPAKETGELQKNC